MKNNNFHQDIFEIYLHESDCTIDQLAQKYGVSPDRCGEELKKIHLIYQFYRNLPEYDPPVWLTNKIRAHAREEAQRRAHRFFWLRIFKPVAAAAAVCLLTLFSVHFWQDHQHQNNQWVASAPSTLETVPFDQPTYNPQWGVRQAASPYLNPWTTLASTGSSTPSMLEDNLDGQFSHGDISSQDAVALFFRAQRLEKQGHYQQARDDYLFIAQRFPQFEYKKALSLSLASCYQNMGEKDEALDVLNNYVKLYGKSEDIVLWMDQLKSETF